MQEFDAKSAIKEAENILSQAVISQKREENAATTEAQRIVDEIKYPGVDLKIQAIEFHFLVQRGSWYSGAVRMHAAKALRTILKDLRQEQTWEAAIGRLPANLVNS